MNKIAYLISSRLSMPLDYIIWEMNICQVYTILSFIQEEIYNISGSNHKDKILKAKTMEIMENATSSTESESNS